MIVLADSSPRITLARAEHLDLLHESYGEIIVSREVHDEIVVAGAGRPGAEEIRRASWIRIEATAQESSAHIAAACVGLGAGERSIIFLALTMKADLVLIDEERARRVAKRLDLNVAGSIAILERGARLGRVADLNAVFLNLLRQGIRYDLNLLNQSLARLGLATIVN